MRSVLVTLLCVVSGSLSPVAAQGVWTPRTVALAPGSQFFLLPSDNVGRAAPSIATVDSLRDPFTNPAIGYGETLRVTTTPTRYQNKQGTVRGFSMPVSAVLGLGAWHAALAWSGQDAHDAPKPVFRNPTGLDGGVPAPEDGHNRYVLGSIGLGVGSATAFGIQLSRADLGLLDGVRRLYPTALHVDGAGRMDGLVAGATLDLGTLDHVEGTYTRSALDMTENVLRWRRDPPAVPGGASTPVTYAIEDTDRSVSQEGRLRYTHWIPPQGLMPGVRLGATAALMRRAQTATSRYDLVEIPRDPGSFSAFEVGVGLESVQPGLRTNLEVTVTPGSSHTSTIADTVVTVDGTTIDPGSSLVDTEFRFRDLRVAAGGEVHGGRMALQLGAGYLSHGLRLAQDDHIFGVRRSSSASWSEWTMSGSVRARLGFVEVGYAIEYLWHGTAPCDPQSFRNACVLLPEPYYETSLSVAPSEPSALPDYRVTTHRLTLSVPLGRR